MIATQLVMETHVAGESEFLFSAFSVFEVVRVCTGHPHCKILRIPREITNRAAATNNQEEPEDLHLAPWC